MTDQVNITYYTDPLCCWSWALESQLEKLRARYGERLSWRYCMGGLIPDWNSYNDPVNSISRPVQMGPLCMEIRHRFQVTINDRIWMTDPPASSYPACIAVKAMGLQSAQAEEEYLSALRHAAMDEGLNIARTDMLINIAERITTVFDAGQFRDDLLGQTGQAAFRKDLEEIRVRSIHRFPALLIQAGGAKGIIIMGYRPYDVLADAVDKILSDLPHRS